MNAVDICNRALARLGEIPNISSINPPEGSVAAEHCAMFYPMVLKTLLERHEWTFAKKVERLALLDVEPDRWMYAYARPADCVRILSLRQGRENIGVFDNHILPTRPMDTSYYETYRIGRDVAICTNVEGAYLEYITSDLEMTKISPSFVEALTMFLAVDLAGALIKGSEGMKVASNFLQLAEATFQKAAVLDASQNKVDRDFEPEAMLWR